MVACFPAIEAVEELQRAGLFETMLASAVPSCQIARARRERKQIEEAQREVGSGGEGMERLE